MSTTVCKFGGSSLSDASMFRRVFDIIQSDSSRRYIVLSAPGKRSDDDVKITDLLYKAYHAGSIQSPYIFSQIQERYACIRDTLCPDFNIEKEIENILSNFHTSVDYAASRGEYLCANLFSAFSGIPFVDAADLIRFYKDGSLDMQSTRERVRSRLSMLDRAVIPGFYASLPDGSIQTFSRGGSDVSGAVIAAAMDADLYENWTDVDGLFTADPRLIPHAKRNPQVSLVQMRSIANAGANLLHPDSLNVLEGSGIDTLIKNTFEPDAGGTRISERCRTSVRCITGKREFSSPGSDNNHSVISIFGLDSTAMRQIHARLKHVCIIHMRDHFEIITQKNAYESSIRAIYQILEGIK